MGIEAGVVAGYVIAWAVRKARRAIGRLDNEADVVIDVGLERLQEMVTTRLAGQPVLAKLAQEAEQAALADRNAGADIYRQMAAALASVAGGDADFGRAVTELTAWLEEQRDPGRGVPHRADVVFAGPSRAVAHHGGIAFGQVAGDVHVEREAVAPTQPGRSGH